MTGWPIKVDLYAMLILGKHNLTFKVNYGKTQTL